MTAKLVLFCNIGFVLAWIGRALTVTPLLWCGLFVGIAALFLFPAPWSGYEDSRFSRLDHQSPTGC